MVKDKRKILLYIKIFSFVFLLMGILSIISYSKALKKEKVFILDKVSIVEKAANVIGDITSNTDNEINSDVVFHKLEDYVDYKLIIKNTTDDDLTIKSITDDSDDQYIKYLYDSHEDEVIEPNDTFELTIKAIYKNEQKDISKRNYKNNVKFIINYLNNNEEGTARVGTNPRTFDDVQVSFVLLIVSLGGLIVCFIAYNKIKYGAASKNIIYLPLVLILFPIIAKSATSKCEIILSSNASLQDKVLVTYIIDGNEATIVNSYGEVLAALEEPYKEGYNFVGWEYEDESSFDSTDPLTNDVKIVAKFERKQCTLIFNTNSSDTTISGEMTNQTVYYGDQVNIETNTFVRDGYKFIGWNTKPDGSGTHYDDGEVISLTIEGDYNLYAEWIESRANLLGGEDINDLFVELNQNMTEFKKSPAKPDLDNIEYKIISTNESNFPVYAWNDNGTIYWWSEADKVFMNVNCDFMFYGMTSLTSVDFTSLDASEVTSMDFMFQRCSSLVTMDLRLDTRNVLSMDAMFANCTKLESIDFSHIDTSKVQNFHGFVAGCSKLTNINLNNFNTEGAISFESMFSTLPELVEIDLSSFTTPNLDSIYFMFLRCSKLTTVYVSEEFDASNVSDDRRPFLQATNIVGGAGTVFNTNENSKTYFRIDDPDNGKPGYLSLKNARYIRYDGNGADGGETMTSHYLKTTNPGNLKTNTYTKTGETFVGWNTKPDGSGDSYTDGELMNTLEASKVPLTLYAQWE